MLLTILPGDEVSIYPSLDTSFQGREKPVPKIEQTSSGAGGLSRKIGAGE